MSSSSMITPILLLRANIDYLSCSITILINIAFILKILRRKRLRTLQNLLVINSSLNLIYSCIIILISITLTLQYSISLYINRNLCYIIGYLMNSCFHGIVYSYVLLSINLFYLKKYHLSKILIIIEIILQWLFIFIIPLFINNNNIDFQIKGRFCYTKQISSLILNILTSLILPFSFLLLLNLIIYLYLNNLRINVNNIQQKKFTSFRQISSQLYRRQNQKHIKLLRQTIIFFIIFFFNSGIFILIILFDQYQIIPDDIYITILTFPSISFLILTLLIKYWIKPANKSLYRSINRHSLSATTVRFSHSININHRNFIE